MHNIPRDKARPIFYIAYNEQGQKDPHYGIVGMENNLTTGQKFLEKQETINQFKKRLFDFGIELDQMQIALFIKEEKKGVSF